jgi:hypothetical protein
MLQKESTGTLYFLSIESATSNKRLTTHTAYLKGSMRLIMMMMKNNKVIKQR